MAENSSIAIYYITNDYGDSVEVSGGAYDAWLSNPYDGFSDASGTAPGGYEKISVSNEKGEDYTGNFQTVVTGTQVYNQGLEQGQQTFQSGTSYLIDDQERVDRGPGVLGLGDLKLYSIDIVQDVSYPDGDDTGTPTTLAAEVTPVLTDKRLDSNFTGYSDFPGNDAFGGLTVEETAALDRAIINLAAGFNEKNPFESRLSIENAARAAAQAADLLDYFGDKLTTADRADLETIINVGRQVAQVAANVEQAVGGAIESLREISLTSEDQTPNEIANSISDRAFEVYRSLARDEKMVLRTLFPDLDKQLGALQNITGSQNPFASSENFRITPYTAQSFQPLGSTEAAVDRAVAAWIAENGSISESEYARIESAVRESRGTTLQQEGVSQDQQPRIDREIRFASATVPVGDGGGGGSGASGEATTSTEEAQKIAQSVYGRDLSPEELAQISTFTPEQIQAALEEALANFREQQRNTTTLPNSGFVLGPSDQPSSTVIQPLSPPGSIGATYNQSEVFKQIYGRLPTQAELNQVANLDIFQLRATLNESLVEYNKTHNLNNTNPGPLFGSGPNAFDIGSLTPAELARQIDLAQVIILNGGFPPSGSIAVNRDSVTGAIYYNRPNGTQEWFFPDGTKRVLFPDDYADFGTYFKDHPYTGPTTGNFGISDSQIQAAIYNRNVTRNPGDTSYLSRPVTNTGTTPGGINNGSGTVIPFSYPGGPNPNFDITKISAEEYDRQRNLAIVVILNKGYPITGGVNVSSDPTTGAYIFHRPDGNAEVFFPDGSKRILTPSQYADYGAYFANYPYTGPTTGNYGVSDSQIRDFITARNTTGTLAGIVPTAIAQDPRLAANAQTQQALANYILTTSNYGTGQFVSANTQGGKVNALVFDFNGAKEIIFPDGTHKAVPANQSINAVLNAYTGPQFGTYGINQTALDNFINGARTTVAISSLPDLVGGGGGLGDDIDLNTEDTTTVVDTDPFILSNPNDPDSLRLVPEDVPDTNNDGLVDLNPDVENPNPDPVDDKNLYPNGLPYDDEGNLMPGWTLDEDGNPVFVGGDFVEPATQALADAARQAAITQAATIRARSQQAIQAQRKQANEGDWRVKLRLAGAANYLYKDPEIDENGILWPLNVSDGVIFPYTPQISTNYGANYTSYDMTHSNYRGYFYQNSFVDEIQLRATFTAQDTTEANYLLAVIHFFRSVTKMFYGQDAQRGAPPPMVFLQGLGEYQFNLHPCVVKNFNYTLPNDVDYIRARSVSVNGTDLLARRDRQTLAGGSFLQSLFRLANASGGGLKPGALTAPPAPPTLGTQNPTYVPTKMEIDITLLPIQTREQISKQFSVKQFANGDLLKGGFW